MIWNVVVCYQKDRFHKSLSPITHDLLLASLSLHSPNFIINYVWMPLLQTVAEPQLQYWLKRIWKNPQHPFSFYHLNSTIKFTTALYINLKRGVGGGVELLSGQGFFVVTCELWILFKGIPRKMCKAFPWKVMDIQRGDGMLGFAALYPQANSLILVSFKSGPQGYWMRSFLDSKCSVRRGNTVPGPRRIKWQGRWFFPYLSKQ